MSENKQQEPILISVIMPARNSERFIETAINSVINQTYTNWELLVINDNSSDHTADIVKQFVNTDSRVVLFENEQCFGVAMTRIKGIQNAKGQYIAFLDSDDQWICTKLSTQIEFLKKTGSKFVFSGSSYMDANGDIFNWVFNVPCEVRYKDLLKQNVISNSSVVIEKKLVEKFYISSSKIHEDYAVWLNILKTGITAYGINEPLIVYRLTSNSKSNNKFISSIMNWKTYRYVGIPFYKALFYQFCYAVNGIKKYLMIAKSKKAVK